MKRKFFWVGTALLLVLLIACGRQAITEESEDITSEYSVEEFTENIESEPEPTDAVEPSLEKPDVILPPEEAFRAVLLSEKPFFYIFNSGPYRNNTSYYDFLDKVMFNDEPIITPCFTIVDMDGDGVPEVVLEIDNYMGFVVLRYKDGEVYGYEVGYRWMYLLKKDGSYHASSSAFEYFNGKMFFIGSTFFDIPEAEVFYDFYYSYDMPIDEQTWIKLDEAFDETPFVEWYEFSEEAIEEWLVDNPTFVDIPPETMAVIIERQNYLDSLSYLVDMTYESYDRYTGSGLEQYRDTAENYYEGCREELDKIYRLCEEKLSTTELEELEAEQQFWEEYMEQSMKEDMNADSYYSIAEPDRKEAAIYFDYGDMVLRRTFRLINLYYDNHFYD